MVRDIEMEEITGVDAQGRVYLPKGIRKKAGIDANTLFNIEIKGKRIILKPRKSVARTGRGIFKLKRPIKDVDRLIKRYSYEKARNEL